VLNGAEIVVYCLLNVILSHQFNFCDSNGIATA
jgi:hypothetical protein